MTRVNCIMYQVYCKVYCFTFRIECLGTTGEVRVKALQNGGFCPGLVETNGIKAHCHLLSIMLITIVYRKQASQFLIGLSNVFCSPGAGCHYTGINCGNCWSNQVDSAGRSASLFLENKLLRPGIIIIICDVSGLYWMNTLTPDPLLSDVYWLPQQKADRLQGGFVLCFCNHLAGTSSFYFHST